jgi:hypothetical protein
MSRGGRASWPTPTPTPTYKEALTLYDPEQHRAQVVRYGSDSGVACGVLGAWTLWMLGYPN